MSDAEIRALERRALDDPMARIKAERARVRAGLVFDPEILATDEIEAREHNAKLDWDFIRVTHELTNLETLVDTVQGRATARTIRPDELMAMARLALDEKPQSAHAWPSLSAISATNYRFPFQRSVEGIYLYRYARVANSYGYPASYSTACATRIPRAVRVFMRRTTSNAYTGDVWRNSRFCTIPLKDLC